MNDYCLVKLEKSLVVDNCKVAAVKLANEGDNSLYGKTCVAAGWGKIKYYGLRSAALLKINTRTGLTDKL